MDLGDQNMEIVHNTATHISIVVINILMMDMHTFFHRNVRFYIGHMLTMFHYGIDIYMSQLYGYKVFQTLCFERYNFDIYVFQITLTPQ